MTPKPLKTTLPSTIGLLILKCGSMRFHLPRLIEAFISLLYMIRPTRLLSKKPTFEIQSIVVMILEFDPTCAVIARSFVEKKN